MMALTSLLRTSHFSDDSYPRRQQTMMKVSVEQYVSCLISRHLPLSQWRLHQALQTPWCCLLTAISSSFTKISCHVKSVSESVYCWHLRARICHRSMFLYRVLCKRIHSCIQPYFTARSSYWSLYKSFCSDKLFHYPVCGIHLGF